MNNSVLTAKEHNLKKQNDPEKGHISANQDYPEKVLISANQDNSEKGLISIKTLHLYLFSVVMLGAVLVLYPALNSPFAQKYVLFSAVGTPITFLLALFIPGLTSTTLLPGQRNIITFIGVNLFFSVLVIAAIIIYFLYYSVQVTLINYIIPLLVLTFLPVLAPGKKQLIIKGPFCPRHFKSWALACFLMIIFNKFYYDPLLWKFENHIGQNFSWFKYEGLKFPQDSQNYHPSASVDLSKRRAIIDGIEGDSIELFNHQNLEKPVEIRWIVTNNNRQDGKIWVYQNGENIHNAELVGLFDMLREKQDKPSANNLVIFNALLKSGKNTIRIQPFIDEKRPNPIEIVDFTGLNRHDFTALFNKHFILSDLVDIRLLVKTFEMLSSQQASWQWNQELYYLKDEPIIMGFLMMPHFMFFVSCNIVSWLEPLQVFTILHLIIMIIMALIMASIFEEISSDSLAFIVILLFQCVYSVVIRINSESCFSSTFFAMTVLFFVFSLYRQDNYASFTLFLFSSISFITGFILTLLIIAFYFLLNEIAGWPKRFFLYTVSFISVTVLILTFMLLFSNVETLTSLMEFHQDYAHRLDFLKAVLQGKLSWEITKLQLYKAVNFGHNLMIFTSWLPLFILPFANKKIIFLIGPPFIYFFLLSTLSFLRLHYLCCVSTLIWTGAPFAVQRLTGQKKKIATIAILILSLYSMALIHIRYQDIFNMNYITMLL